jgi:hypothetical protein
MKDNEERETTKTNTKKIEHQRNMFSKCYNFLVNEHKKAGVKRQLSYTGLSEITHACPFSSILYKCFLRLCRRDRVGRMGKERIQFFFLLPHPASAPPGGTSCL